MLSKLNDSRETSGREMSQIGFEVRSDSHRGHRPIEVANQFNIMVEECVPILEA